MNFAIVLAAGSSTRIGSCKAALPWGVGQTLLSYQMDQWQQIGITPIPVLGLHNASLSTFAVINPNPNSGKTGSIRVGLQALPADWNVVAISAVDQPRSSWIYQTLFKAQSQCDSLITAPSYQDRLGHPLLFAASLMPVLLNLQEETLGLRQILQDRRSDIHKVEFNTPEVLVDINTPEVYTTQFDHQLIQICTQFLQKSHSERLQFLKQLGLARYASFLTQMVCNESNIIGVSRFFRDPSRVKFPNLRGTDLSGLVLDDVNLIRADLRDANLSNSRLWNADLIFANLSGSDLRNADLRGATLNQTTWTGAQIDQCQFGSGIGLTSEQQLSLQLGGGIFGENNEIT